MAVNKKKKKGFGRRMRRFLRRHPRLKAALPVLQGVGAFAAVLLIAFGIFMAVRPRPVAFRPEIQLLAPEAGREAQVLPRAVATSAPTAQPTPVPTTAPTAVPTASPTPEPTPVTIDGVEEPLYYQEIEGVSSEADNARNGLLTAQTVYREMSPVAVYKRATDVRMAPSAQYTALEGVTTFRGSAYRDGGAYGTIPEDPSDLKIVWQKKIKGLDKWRGVGWTGQASVVRWPEQTRVQMNITPDKKSKYGLIEAVYATLDGHIYFFDLEDGEPTRDAINIGAPVKGSVTVDPRGIPLLYCGQGIYEVDGKKVKCGTRIWSLYDQSLLYMIDGDDDTAMRNWYAFDCTPLVDAASDTMVTAGENGVLYTVTLNTRQAQGMVSIAPQVDRYTYAQARDGKLGTENSVVIYNHYVYFATNIGVIQCVDLNTMRLVWTFDAEDDMDATMSIEVEPDGMVALYAANELDKRGGKGVSQMYKLDALTGRLIWRVDSDRISHSDENGGGSFATPAVGKGTLGGLVYFHVARTKETKGMLYALDKATGERVWEKSMGSYGWSSPTLVYAPSGKGYLLVGSSSGKLRLMDGLTGDTVADVTLDGVIEGSPAVFDDMLIIGTRDSMVYGIRIR